MYEWPPAFILLSSSLPLSGDLLIELYYHLPQCLCAAIQHCVSARFEWLIVPTAIHSRFTWLTYTHGTLGSKGKQVQLQHLILTARHFIAVSSFRFTATHTHISVSSCFSLLKKYIAAPGSKIYAFSEGLQTINVSAFKRHCLQLG